MKTSRYNLLKYLHEHDSCNGALSNGYDRCQDCPIYKLYKKYQSCGYKHNTKKGQCPGPCTKSTQEYFYLEKQKKINEIEQL